MLEKSTAKAEQVHKKAIFSSFETGGNNNEIWDIKTLNIKVG
jgi:hypothetical protein